MKTYKLKLVLEDDTNKEGLVKVLEREIAKEEVKDRLDTNEYLGHTVAEILDDEDLQRESQNKGVHIGFTFPVTVTKLDVKDFVKGKRDNLKVLILHDTEE